MRKLVRRCMIAASLFVTATAHAQCSVSSDRDSAVRPLNAAVQADANLVASMTMLPKLMHIDYESAAKTTGCNLGQFTAGDAMYELWGDDAGGRHRKAVPAKKGSPVAIVLPVIDILKAVAAQQQGKSAQVEGYLLATITTGDFTGWRYYTGMPDPATLKHDMADVLSHKGSPIFQSGSDGKINLFVPNG